MVLPNSNGEFYQNYDIYRQKDRQYLKYISRHINNVQMIYSEFSKENELEECIKLELSKNIRNHDMSKTDFREYIGYLQWFYPEHEDKKDLVKFQYAWNHHQKNNPHHWEYWILINNTNLIALEMPLEYVLEMLCDWSAMSIEFGDTPSQFYNNTKDKKILHEKTKEQIIKYLPIFDEIVKDIKVECHNIYY